MELLILLVQRQGELVSREEIAERLWGKGVFLDTDHSINTAIRKVRAALRDDPEKPRFIETVVGKGYRFAAPVVYSNGDSSPQPAPGEPPSPPMVPSMEARTPSPRTRLVLGAIALLVLLTVGMLLSRGRAAEGTSQPAIKSLAVLPLTNLSGDPSQQYLADGITDALIGRLASIHQLRVISRTSVMRFKNTRLPVPEIARSLGVDGIVEGSVIRDGSRIRVTAQLIRGSTDGHFWSETYDREFRDVLELESDVAQSIADRVEVTLTGEERARLIKARHVSPEVYESYLKGEFENGNTKEDIEKSIAYFEDAIKRDPTFAPAYVGLASAYDSLGTVGIGVAPAETRPKELAAVQKALDLDPDLAEAHVLLADIFQKRWHWAEAETEYQRALELNPNDASANLGLADWLMCQGRMEEALVRVEHARQIDPVAAGGLSEGWILFQAHRYSDSIRELRSVIAVHPDYATAYWFLGFSLTANGQSKEAIPVLRKALDLSRGSPGVIGVLVRAYAHAGRRAEALRLLGELKRRQQKGYIPAAAFVNAYLGLDDRQQAFIWLDRAYKEQSNILQFAKVHPYFDPLRDDPRFKDLLHRVDLAD